MAKVIHVHFAAPGQGVPAAPVDADAPCRRREPPTIDLDAIGEFGRLSAQMCELMERIGRLPDEALFDVCHGGVREMLTVRELVGRNWGMIEEREDVLRPFSRREHDRMASVLRRSVRLSRE